MKRLLFSLLITIGSFILVALLVLFICWIAYLDIKLRDQILWRPIIFIFCAIWLIAYININDD